MGILQDAARTYGGICKHTYQYTFDNGKSITVRFHPNNFCHLAGLRKFDDLREFQVENGKPVLSSTNIFKKALNDEFTDFYLQTSKAYNQEAYDRIACLSDLCRLLKTCQAVYGFNRKNLRIVTKLKSDVILFSNEGYNFYLMLGLAEDGYTYYPETFFLRFDDAYIRGQNIVNVVNLEIL